MAGSIIALTPTHDPLRWTLPLVPGLCTGPRGGATFMFGGIGLAAAVAAMEEASGRPAICATAQYVAFARPPAIVELEIDILAQGRSVSQASAVARVGTQTVLAAHAALGGRRDDGSLQKPPMPTAPLPDACARVRHWNARDDAVQSLFDVRLAAGRFPDGRPIAGAGAGRVLIWVRPLAGHAIDTRLLSVVGDYVSVAITDALGGYADGNSLDNTIRFAAIEDCAWMLCDIRIESIHDGFVHGSMHIFSQSGRLMAVASQSLILRRHPPTHDGRPLPPRPTPDGDHQ